MVGGTKYKSTNTKITRDLPRFQEAMETCEARLFKRLIFHTNHCQKPTWYMLCLFVSYKGFRSLCQQRTHHI